MPTRSTTSLEKYFLRKLTLAGWPGVVLDETTHVTSCSKGEIIKLSNNQYTLQFITYSERKREYYDRENYKGIIFPKNFNIKRTLYFKIDGNYKISCEPQLKKIINPQGKEIAYIKIVEGRNIRRFHSGNLILSRDIYNKAQKDAEEVYSRKKSYANSSENYLSKQASRKYSNEAKSDTTFLEKGEFSFAVDRFNLPTKKKKSDFEKYLNPTDISSIETLVDALLKNEVLSDEFLRRLNDYFIKERLKDIIAFGKSILNLGSTNLGTSVAQELIGKLEVGSIGQLETLWQKYFEKYLLYLIFSYKKIFPKVELTNIIGTKRYPDFIGINHYNGLDVIEIKTHLQKILIWDNSHENFYFSPEMSKAIVQTMNYMDGITQQRFQNPDDRTKITEFTDEENLYHPRGIIIISSDSKLTTRSDKPEELKRDFTKLRNSLQNIEILTFNEILNIADEYIKNITSEVNNEQS